MTYHGPGQLVAYLLIDLKRIRLGVRQLVVAIETAVIKLLDSYGIEAYGRRDAPGVYVAKDGAEAKMAALGLKVRNGCTYHGFALNLDMDLAPFDDIDPCGYRGLAVTQLSDLGVRAPRAEIEDRLVGEVVAGDCRRRSEAHDERYARAFRRSLPRHRPRLPASSTRAAPRPRGFRSRSSPRSGCRSQRGYAHGLRRRRVSTTSSASCASTICIQFAKKHRARTSGSASARAPRRS